MLFFQLYTHSNFIDLEQFYTAEDIFIEILQPVRLNLTVHSDLKHFFQIIRVHPKTQLKSHQLEVGSFLTSIDMHKAFHTVLQI